jgi:hypothetical protein
VEPCDKRAAAIDAAEYGRRVGDIYAELVQLQQGLEHAHDAANRIQESDLPPEIEPAQLEPLRRAIESGLRIVALARQPLDAVVAHRTRSLSDPDKVREKAREAATLRRLGNLGVSPEERWPCLRAFDSGAGSEVVRRRRLRERALDDERRAQEHRAELEDECARLEASWRDYFDDWLAKLPPEDAPRLATELHGLRDAFVADARARILGRAEIAPVASCVRNRAH